VCVLISRVSCKLEKNENLIALTATVKMKMWVELDRKVLKMSQIILFVCFFFTHSPSPLVEVFWMRKNVKRDGRHLIKDFNARAWNDDGWVVKWQCWWCLDCANLTYNFLFPIVYISLDFFHSINKWDKQTRDIFMTFTLLKVSLSFFVLSSKLLLRHANA
jgi:hypothetical protein